MKIIFELLVLALFFMNIYIFKILKYKLQDTNA